MVIGDDILPDMYELPPELFDCLMTRLPPLALQKFQNEMFVVMLSIVNHFLFFSCFFSLVNQIRCYLHGCGCSFKF